MRSNATLKIKIVDSIIEEKRKEMLLIKKTFKPDCSKRNSKIITFVNDVMNLASYWSKHCLNLKYKNLLQHKKGAEKSYHNYQVENTHAHDIVFEHFCCHT